MCQVVHMSHKYQATATVATFCRLALHWARTAFGRLFFILRLGSPFVFLFPIAYPSSGSALRVRPTAAVLTASPLEADHADAEVDPGPLGGDDIWLRAKWCP